MKNPIGPILDAVRPDTVRRPTGTLRARPSSYIDAYYSTLDNDDGVDDDDARQRPSHVRENSRSALLARSHRASHASRASRPSTTFRDSRIGREYELDEGSDDDDSPHANNMADLEMDTKGAAVDGAGVRPGVALQPATGKQDLTPVQRKMAIVSAALEETGMGKYQWCIFVLCGFGYALDLMWAQAFGLVTPRIQQELDISDADYGTIFSVFSAGLTVGAFMWGILVDIIGRRWAFNLTIGIVSLFGMLLGATSSWAAICALTFFVGTGLGGNIPIDATIVMEFIPANKRYLLAVLSVFQPIGVIITSLLSWALVPQYACGADLPACSALPAGTPQTDATCCTKASNYGWRYALFCFGGISLGAFLARFLLFNFRESPRFLISKGRDAEAVAVVHEVARTNGRVSALTLEELVAIDEASDAESALYAPRKPRHKWGPGLGHLKALFATPRMVRLTILTWLVYCADYWGFTIAGAFLPKILADRGAAADVSTATTYRNYILVSIAGVPGVMLGAALIEVPVLGRKWVMVASSALMGVSLFLYSAITTPEASTGFNAMEYFFQSTFNAVLYGWTPEAFPASVRGSAAGLASFWGRLTSIVAPLIVGPVYAHGGPGVLYMAGAGVFVATVLCVFLPDTRRVEVL